ncbi:MAG: hypothetical protein EOO65_01915, partial [Methanosarcinales archaeon]
MRSCCSLAVREKSKLLVDLLSDAAQLRSERDRARETTSKFVGLSNDGASGSGMSGGTSSYESQRRRAERSDAADADEWNTRGASFADPVPAARRTTTASHATSSGVRRPARDDDSALDAATAAAFGVTTASAATRQGGRRPAGRSSG